MAETKEEVKVFLSVREAARRTGYNPQHLRLLIRQGKIRAIRSGWSWLIDESDLARYRAFVTNEKP